ncbi:glutathione S-transferase family protein [Nitrosomonas sp. HPC101]|uniref:glutathione S-transferase family protein n=1 Tax=Nitrosomonas sp. HPC101 TaxID=1658667 RepID=UPI00136ECCD7|nr:glutathione S-transferase family protein [Nitrosomonas sp. HPC101]MXS86483.1 glutathione S-transferase family protein [Nitrosomonas sp. HPC101]
MGLLIDGTWHDQWYTSKNGEFVRENAQYRNWVTADGQPGLSGEGGFAAESGRYHLFISLACPWAHRTLIFRSLKDLQTHIGVTVVDPRMLEHGWTFSEVSRNNPVSAIQYLHQLYTRVKSDYTGRVTVPVLWDKQRNTIVSNESSEIIRMLNSAFDALTGNDLDFYPEALRSEIDTINEVVYRDFNNGVYRAGFATEQSAYERAYDQVFARLDTLDHTLGERHYLTGDQLTEADWRLFTTLIRFDSVYYSHFKLNKKRIEDYSNLSNYLRALYQMPDIASTVNFEHIKTHYYYSHPTINPTRIIPKGPEIDYTRPHNRVFPG